MLLLIAGLIESLLLYPMFHVFAIAIAIAIAVVFVVNATSEHARGYELASSNVILRSLVLFN